MSDVCSDAMKINKLCSATAVCVVLPCVMEPSCLRCPPSHRLKPLTLRHACVVFPSRIERQRHRKRDAHNAQQVRGASSHNQCPIQADPGLAAAARTTACVCTPRAETELSRSGLDLELMPKGIASSGAARLRSAPEIGAAVHIPPVLLADTSKNMSMNACGMHVHNAGPS